MLEQARMRCHHQMAMQQCYAACLTTMITPCPMTDKPAASRPLAGKTTSELACIQLRHTHFSADVRLACEAFYVMHSMAILLHCVAQIPHSGRADTGCS